METELTAEAQPAAAPNLSLLKVFLLCFALSLINGYLFGYIHDHFFPSLAGNPIDKESLLEQFFVAGIVAPLLETWIFQHIANKALVKAGVRNFYVLLIVPALLFGLSHYYNLLYIIAMFFGGAIMNYLYLYCKANGYKAFWWVVLLHSLYNLFGILFV
jgi:membrane protease YdiL (CAAX protease family)